MSPGNGYQLSLKYRGTVANGFLSLRLSSKPVFFYFILFLITEKQERKKQKKDKISEKMTW